MKAGRFREDLYYRLHVLEIELPPLARRREDIPALCAVFLGTIAPGRQLQLSPDAAALLREHSWPGNVRELRNVLEHAIAVSSGGTIFPQHLPRDLRGGGKSGSQAAGLETALRGWIDEQLRTGAHYEQIHDRIEAMLLRMLLSRFGDKPTVLARVLNMNRVTLRRKCRELFAGPGDEGH